MKKPVMVVGGGIAGIEASSNLAQMGIPVFLVENSPSIGGRMGQLDKTFPTNDCSACILAPKVTDCFNHPLVKTLTMSDLLDIKGDAPDFTAVVKRRARYIDEDTCKGCSDCVDVCPVTVKSEYDMGLGSRKAIYKPFAQAVPNKTVIDKKGTSPCKYNCPAKLDAHGYVTLTGEGRYEEALKVVRRTTPFAGVLGRVCLHPCEENCTRQYVEEPVSIAALKRFIADFELSKGDKPSTSLPENINIKNDKIAIIGAGPAGLNCAYQLLLQGYKPVIFEALPVAGGMLKVGIPDYRLDKNILQGEIDIVTGLGAEIKFNKKLGRDFTISSLKNDGYKAIFIAIGAHKDVRLGIPGEDNTNVLSSVDFLRDLNLDNKPVTGEKVIIIGGGNVAMDAARSARRLGSEVTILYRRTRAEMPANEWEIHHALEEGITICELTTQIEVIEKNSILTGLKCIKNKLGKKDKSGRRSPVAISGSEFILPADTIIVAIGQKVDDDILGNSGIDKLNRWGTIEIDEHKGTVLLCSNNETQENRPLVLEGVFAGGDATRGPATMIEAVADGNKSAVAIRNYLEGTNLPIEPPVLPQTPIEEIETDSLKKQARAKMPLISLEERLSTFKEVETGYSEETAKAEALRCAGCSVCCECKLCEEACASGALLHLQTPETYEIPLSAVVLAPGFDVSRNIPPELGYNRFADVVTSLEYERILSASGPFGGHVQRPSDGRAPKRIAFIQCVGSREQRCGGSNEYCSSVCCMYAVKEAQITKEHLPSVEDIHIYYMDMRAYGKDFDKYADSAKTKYGIDFIRSRVGGVEKDETTGELIVSHCNENGDFSNQSYDIVVLSVGMEPSEDTKVMLKNLGIRSDRYGFISPDILSAPETSRPGILACGVAAGPKDIPETVVEASAAAAGAAKVANRHEVDLYKDYSQFFIEEPEVPERDVSKEPLRIGVFVCHCGVNIGGYLTITEVVKYAAGLPFVVYSDESLYTCSVDAQKNISEMIIEHRLNRVVVASCTPRTHEPLFQNVLKKSGLNPYLFTMANIRDQCSWVHMDDMPAATEKAKELVSMAVAKVTLAKQLKRKKIHVDKAALVIGGGMSGLSAATELSSMGYHVYVVERSDKLGGNAMRLDKDTYGRDIIGYLHNTINNANNDDNISILLNSDITEIDGYVGNFNTKVSTPDGIKEFTHGVVIVATGANPHITDRFLYGNNKNVMTHLELEHILRQGDGSSVLNAEGIPATDTELTEAFKTEEPSPCLSNIVLIQCVDSRDATHPYCSRVCCNQAIRNALKLKKINPDCNVTIMYREIRSYGTNEKFYTEARRKGVEFVRFNDDDYPVVTEENGCLKVTVNDPLLGKPIEYPADIVSLASAISPDTAENMRIAQMLKIPLNAEGFFLEAHVKLRPVDFATEGVYIAGLAHTPKSLQECMVQGKAAAGRAATVLAKDMLETEGTIACVDTELCTACGACENVCAYKAIEVQDIEWRRQTIRKATVNDVLCKGCGTCSATCRCGAIDIAGFTDEQIINEIEYLLRS
ncbi:MAG: FAD-dependent oxidoreductase [Oscillospiraceae bacterium]|nr:FAD-dependent oxidoreductase [Oscillospiraceae bacterium]